MSRAGVLRHAMTLDDVLTDSFRLLSRGVADRRSPFRNPALATVAAGRPSVRTVVLRAFDPAERRLVVHTDARAAKITEVLANPAVALHAWDTGPQVQLRLVGVATVHQGDARAGAEWARLHAGSRLPYGVASVPGTVIPDPDAPVRLPDGTGFAHFAVLDIALHSLEWLRLGR